MFTRHFLLCVLSSYICHCQQWRKIKSVSTESNNEFPVHCYPTYVDVSSVTGTESVAVNTQQFCLFNIVVEVQNISYLLTYLLTYSMVQSPS